MRGGSNVAGQHCPKPAKAVGPASKWFVRQVTCTAHTDLYTQVMTRRQPSCSRAGTVGPWEDIEAATIKLIYGGYPGKSIPERAVLWESLYSNQGMC